MANINTPISATQTKAILSNEVENPATKVGGDLTTGDSVFITLRFTGGLKYKASEIYEAIDNQFGVIANEKNSLRRGMYILNVAGSAGGNTPVSAAGTSTEAADPIVHPAFPVGGDATCGSIAFITLRFAGGQTIKPKEIYEAFDAKFGTVASTKALPNREGYEFQIEA